MTYRRLLLAFGLLVLCVGCMQYTPSELAGTATTLGCWPYGYHQPPPPRTPVATPPATVGPGTPAPIITPTVTPVPTYVACTPLPLTPTLTPSPTPSPTPWTRPTALPGVVGNQEPLNISNQAGYDVDPSIAVHPSDGWAAIVWSNWIWEFPEEATIVVKVQDPRSRVWSPGIGVNTGPVEKGGGAPAITIDQAGRVHVVFLQDNQPVYTMSADYGRTWTDPLTIPGAQDGGYFFQLVVDAADQLHVLYATSPAYDEFYFIHAQRSADGTGPWIWQGPITSGRKLLYGDLTTVQLPSGQIRTVVVLGCRTGCAVGPVVATQDGPGAAWMEQTIPNVTVRISPQVVQWIDVIGFTTNDGQPEICTAWGQYSKSAVHASCSTNFGDTWSSTEVIAYHDEPPPNPEAPTTGPTAAVPTAGPSDEEDGGDAFNSADRGYHPELLYVPQSDRLMAIWVLRERMPPSGATNPYYLVYSWRDRTAPHWTPIIDGPMQEPPLRLFDDTRRSAARNPRLAWTSQGQAWATWIEVERDENIEVYVAPFTASALLSGGQ